MPPFSKSGNRPAAADISSQQNSIYIPSLKYPIIPISERFVSFCSSIQVFRIPNKEEYSRREASDIWYNVKELKKMKREASRESFTVERFQRQHKNHINNLYAVLSEQYKQHQLGQENPEHLRIVCEAGSEDCLKEALDAASVDEFIAKDINQENDIEIEFDDFNFWLFCLPQLLFSGPENLLFGLFGGRTLMMRQPISSMHIQDGQR